MRRYIQHCRTDQVPAHPRTVDYDSPRREIDTSRKTACSYEYPQGTLVVSLGNEFSFFGRHSRVWDGSSDQSPKNIVASKRLTMKAHSFDECFLKHRIKTTG